MINVIKKLLQVMAVDEEWYSHSYPDVAKAIDLDAYCNAKPNFVDHGYFEWRHPSEKEIDQA